TSGGGGRVDHEAGTVPAATSAGELEGGSRVSVVGTGIDKTAAEIAAAPIAIRQAPHKPAPRPAFHEQRPAAPQPVQPVLQEPVRADPVAEAIRQADMHAAAVAARAAQQQQAADDFRPQSKLFQAPPPAPQPYQHHQQAAPIPQREVAPQMTPPRMPRVEDFPPVVKAEVEAKSRGADHQEGNGPMGL